MLTETAAAIGSIKAAFDIAKGVQALQTTTDVKQAISDMLDQLLSARLQAVEAAESEAKLQAEIESLRNTLATMKAWEEEAAKYALKEVAQGTYAFQRTEFEDPRVWLCPNCFDDRRKSVLQTELISAGRMTMLQCKRCDFEIVTDGHRPRLDSLPQPRRR